MTTIEKLFVQIFERKDRIIEEIQRQSDLYRQHLASKLLIQGIAPPPWLWNPSFKSLPSDPGELKKEELISEFLYAHPQPPVPYIGVNSSRYSRPVVIGDNGELSEGLFMETQASNKDFNGGDKSTAPSDFHDNNIGCALNRVPESDPSVSSPEGQVDAMISNIYTAPDQSLARIQRSKSRQKALELRKSANGAAKSHLVDENDSGFHCSGIRMSGIASRQLNHDYEFSELAKHSDTINGSGSLRLEIGECHNEANMYCGRSTGCRSSYISAEKSKYKEVDNCSNMSKKDGVLKSESTSGGGISKPVSLFNTFSQRITRSKSAALKMPQLESSNRLEGLQLQNVPSGEVIQHFPEGIPVISKQELEDNYVAEIELISDGPGEVLATCSNLDAAGLGVGLDVFVSRQPSDRSMFVRPKTLEFDDMEKGSLNEIYSQGLGESSEKMSHISLKSATSLDKTDNSSPSRKFLDKQSREHVVSDKTSEAWRRSFGSRLEEYAVVDKGVPKSNMNKNLKNFEDNSEAIEDILHYPASLVADVESSNFGKRLDLEGHQEVKYHSMEGYESSSKFQVKECELACDGDRRDRSGTTPILFKHQQLGPCFISNETKHVSLDKVCLVEEAVLTDPRSSVVDERQCCAEDNQEFICHGNELSKGNMSGLACIDSTLLQKKGHSREDGFLPRDSFCSLHCVDKNFNSSEIKELKLLEESLTPRRKLRPAKEKSWPQFKRRKIEDKPTDFFSTSPRFRVKGVDRIGGYTRDRYLNSVEDEMEPLYKFQCHQVTPQGGVGQSNINKSSDMEMAQKVNHLTTGSEPSLEVQLEVDACTTTPTSNHGRFGLYAVSSSIKEAAGHSESCCIENGKTADATSIVLKVRTESDKQNYISLPHFENDVALENKDDSVHDHRIQQKTLSLVEENGFISNSSFVSLHENHLASVAADQTLPEFEGFVIDKEENAQPPIIEDAFSFENLDLPRATIERVNVLEQLCKSAIVHTPLSQFSTTFKLHRTLDPYQSLPNGLLEHMNFTSSLNIDDDSGKHLRASCSSVNEVKCSFQGLPNSNCMPLNGSHFGWSARKPPMSPVGKLWDRILSNSSSSEKQRSLNPELTCFPIEEDPSFCEENENRDEVADTIHKNSYSSLMNHHAQIEPLAEATEKYANCLASVSMAGKYPNRCSSDSINTELNFKESNRVKQKLGNCHGNKGRITNEDKGNHTMSVSMNGTKKATESLKNRFSKPKLSGKTSLRKDGQNLPEREPKRNNIVSNITSFVPLVQKKQETKAGTGKRNIKVKALEAAEAAKRLQEKRENERKMKKEALKLEKAKVDKENLRQMELRKKKKEEEQKKKDASMAERKRLREEEERKEKERKRKRTEEAWQQQKEPKENLHIQKVEKDAPFTVIDEEVNSEAKFIDGLKKQKKDKEKGDDSLVKKLHTESATAEIMENNVNLVVLQDCEAANHCSQIRELTSVLTKTTTNNDREAKASQEKSYEISPYQCSDDEDDEEDEIPTKKFIPSWASKSSVAVLLSSQEKIDPAMIFPPESFCHINEVLRPRK